MTTVEVSKKKIEDLCRWGKPKRVNTKRGERDLYVSTPTSEFWDYWREFKAELKEAGVSVSKDDFGSWVVNYWKPISVEEQASRRASVAKSSATGTSTKFPSPENLEYYPFQSAGIEYALGRSNTLIADDMGLGKTIQAIGVINADPSIRRALVICPASVKGNWKTELERWLVEPRSVQILSGGKAVDVAGEIVVVNYDLLGKYAAKLEAIDWDLKVVDEAHYIKNPKAKRTRSAKAIKATRTIALTGTPIVNYPKELWPILSMLDGNRWSGKSRFERRYCDGHTNQYGYWDATGASNLPELHRILRETVMVRRLKSDVLTELPPKRRQIISVDSAPFKDLIAAQDKLPLDQIEREFQENAFSKESIALVFEEVSALRKATAIKKIPYVLDWIKEILESTGKLIVFAHHYEVIDAIKDSFGSASVGIDGRTPAEDREAIVNRFQADPSVRVFVGGIRSAGEGITLTAASTVLFAEIDWTPGKMTQAEDRAHRIGQSDSVHVFHLVVDKSIDARLIQLIIQKQEIADRALDKDRQESPEPVKPVADSIPEIPREKPDRPRGPIVSDAERELVHAKLRALAGVCDYALKRDNNGFNGTDALFGHSLAERTIPLTDGQLKAAKAMLVKYSKQLQSLGFEK